MIDLPFSGQAVAVLRRTCCPRCVLRLAHIYQPEFYLRKEAEIDALLPAAPASPDAALETTSPFRCSTCLGILQDASLDAADPSSCLGRLLSVVSESSYDMKQFSFVCTFPHSVLVRQFLVLTNLYRLKLFSSSPLTWKVLELKEALRFSILTPLVARHPFLEFLSGSPLTLQIIYTHPETDRDHENLWTSTGGPPVDVSVKRSRRAAASTPLSEIEGSSVRALQRAMEDFPLESPPHPSFIPPPPVLTTPVLSVSVSRQSIFVYGQYNKYDRQISQTPWLVEGSAAKIDTSLEECIRPSIVSVFRAKSGVFHSAGREDIDVRMLGSGRPFVVELIDSERESLGSEEWKTLENHINEKSEIAVHGLRVCSKNAFDSLQNGAEEKKKQYVCVVQTTEAVTDALLKEKIDSVCELTIQQLTPIRVLHRRTLMTRPKVIHDMRTEFLNHHYFILHLTTSAGTYVKEFVHGDLGRTQPNVGSLLGVESDIIQLDVEDLLELHVPP